MKDRLGRNAWWNNPVSNETQNRYRRFFKTPGGDIRTAFTESIEWFDKFKDEQKTVYERYIGEL